MSVASERFVAALAKTLATRERDRAPVRNLRVVGRASDGTPLTVRSDAQCIARGTATPDYYNGQSIFEPSGNSGGSSISSQGTASVAALLEETAAATLWVERLDPSTYIPGRSYFVNVYGRGFDDTTRFEFLDPDGETVNPDITIVDQGVLGPDQAALEIEVSPTARLQANLPLAYGRGSR